MRVSAAAIRGIYTIPPPRCGGGAASQCKQQRARARLDGGSFNMNRSRTAVVTFAHGIRRTHAEAAKLVNDNSRNECREKTAARTFARNRHSARTHIPAETTTGGAAQHRSSYRNENSATDATRRRSHRLTGRKSPKKVPKETPRTRRLSCVTCVRLFVRTSVRTCVCV